MDTLNGGAVVAAEYVAPQINFTISQNLQTGARKLAFFLAVCWLIYLAAQVAIPSRRGGMNNGGAGKMLLAAIPILFLLDLNLLKTFANWILQIIWNVWKAISG